MPSTGPLTLLSPSSAHLEAEAPTGTDVILTPDQRLRVFVSSALKELAAERQAVRDAVTLLRLVPVMFELGARPHPAKQLYRAYLAQSQVFVGVYWQSYGWVQPGEQISGLEDEYLQAADLPKLIYVKSPAPEREPRLTEMLARIKDDGRVSYQRFSDAADLRRLVENDLAVLLSERFEMTQTREETAGPPLAGALPAPATPLVGRQQDTAAIADLALGQGARLITLTGPGGVGKSRLAIHAATRLRPEFPGGVRFIDLAPVQSADLVPAAGARDLPERQRTLKNTLDWSFDLLSPGEQALFARLGVFSGTFGLPAAEAVCGGTGTLCGDAEAADPTHAGPLIETLGSLVDSSLVRAEPRGGEPRFRLLDTIRDYALQRLQETGDWTGAHDRHAAYFLALAEPAESELSGPGQLAWLDRLGTRHDNLAAALSWLTGSGQLGQAIHLMWATWKFWWLHGHPGELAQYDRAVRHFTDGLHAARSAPDRFPILVSLYDLALGSQALGRLPEAAALLKEGLSLATDTGDKPTIAYYLEALAGIASSQGSRRRAGRLRADAAALLQANGSGWLHAYVPRTADKEVRPHARHRDPA